MWSWHKNIKLKTRQSFTHSKTWQYSASRRTFSIVSSYGGHTTAGQIASVGLIGVCSLLYLQHSYLAVKSGLGTRVGIQNGDIAVAKMVAFLEPWIEARRPTAELARQHLTKLRKNFMASRRQLDKGQWYTALTSSFMHINWWHMGINLLCTRTLVTPFAQSVGFPVFALVWSGAALSGTYAQFYAKDLLSKVTSGRNIPIVNPDRKAVGASAALCGLLGSLTMMFPWAFKRAILVLVGTSLVCEYTGFAPFIGHESHLGGLGFGILFGALFLKRVPRHGPRRF